ncbi:MAG: haloacid dehalogenase type II, partial [Alphaproteobacteria bacterium]|nr:haloacid dehalogenase type II [Alphaproteobacteria bacterium]
DTVDWVDFATSWRKKYQPAMQKIRDGHRPFTILDVLHRENLIENLSDFGVSGLSDDEIDDLNHAWHRLSPWPDSVEGLTMLKSKYIIAPQSNGNIALMVNMAKFSGLPWDAILGAEVVRHYKPQPQAYLNACAALGLRPEQVVMTAAHNGDLQAAALQGMRTAFVARPKEHGDGQTTDLKAEADYTFVAESFVDLARQVGCD